MKKIKTILSWSTGKDSAWTLYQLQQNPEIELVGLFTSINQQFDRVAMHAVRVELLKLQAQAAGQPDMPMALDIIPLPFPCSNEDYQRIMDDYFAELTARGVQQIAFGDLFLEDVRDYRINQLRDTGLTPIFPLWGMDTTALAHTLVDHGVKAVTTCIDPKKLPHSLCGRYYDTDFLTQLKQITPAIDPCGENGEFHTFVYDGPMFHRPIEISVGDVVTRDGFVFADVLPNDTRK